MYFLSPESRARGGYSCEVRTERLLDLSIDERRAISCGDALAGRGKRTTLFKDRQDRHVRRAVVAIESACPVGSIQDGII
jgi:hypothetical protein